MSTKRRIGFGEWEQLREQPFQIEMAKRLGVFIRWDGKMSERRMTYQEHAKAYPYHGQMPQMKCVVDVINTLEGITELVSKSTKPSSETKEMAALAADALGLLAIYMLTIHTGQESSEVSFARLVTRLFAKYGMTPKSLSVLRDTLELSLQYERSDESK